LGAGRIPARRGVSFKKSIRPNKGGIIWNVSHAMEVSHRKNRLAGQEENP